MQLSDEFSLFILHDFDEMRNLKFFNSLDSLGCCQFAFAVRLKLIRKDKMVIIDMIRVVFFTDLAVPFQNDNQLLNLLTIICNGKSRSI